MSRFRPMKVMVQVVGAIEDDDGNLTEQATEPVAVPFKDWRKFADPDGDFDRSILAIQDQVSGPPANV